jgi:hypothetical protein
MRLYLSCEKCVVEPGSPARKFPTEVEDSGLYKLVCPNGHETVSCIQQLKFEILFDLGAYAILDGYYRDAVASFTAAMERFFEFFVEVQCEKQGIDFETFDATWDRVSSRSERELGAFIIMYLLAMKKPPTLLSNNNTKFRNDVIHKGRIPTKEEAIQYGEKVAEVLISLLDELRSVDPGPVKRTMIRHLGRLYKSATIRDRSTLYTTTFIAIGRRGYRRPKPQPTLREYIESLHPERRMRESNVSSKW